MKIAAVEAVGDAGQRSSGPRIRHHRPRRRSPRPRRSETNSTAAAPGLRLPQHRRRGPRAGTAPRVAVRAVEGGQKAVPQNSRASGRRTRGSGSSAPPARPRAAARHQPINRRGFERQAPTSRRRAPSQPVWTKGRAPKSSAPGVTLDRRRSTHRVQPSSASGPIDPLINQQSRAASTSTSQRCRAARRRPGGYAWANAGRGTAGRHQRAEGTGLHSRARPSR